MAPLPRFARLLVPALLLSSSLVALPLPAQVDFVETGPFTLPADAAVLEPADLNGDGHLDLVSAHFGSTQLRFSLGDGTGSFTLQPGVLDVGFNPGSIATGDLDGNSLADIVVTSLGTPTVVYYQNLGGMTFVVLQLFDPGSLPIHCEIADFTGDGIDDLAVAKGANAAFDPPAVRLYLNDGTGLLAAGASDFPVGPNPVQLVVASLNGDTWLDIAVACTGEFFGPDGSISLLLGSGPADFAPAVPFGALHPSQLSVADLDGNGSLDIASIVATAAFGCGFEGQLYLNDGLGTFTSGQAIDFGCGPIAVRAADFDLDGATELLFTDGGDLIPAANFFVIAERDALGNFVVGAATYNGFYTLALPALGDYDEDGLLDVAFGGYLGGLTIWRNESTPPVSGFRRGDTNEDGNFDIADPVRLLGVLFTGGTDPLNCPDSGDGNDDGLVNIADAVSLLGALFGSGGPPPAPFPACGPDPTADTLPDCAAPPAGC